MYYTYFMFGRDVTVLLTFLQSAEPVRETGPSPGSLHHQPDGSSRVPARH